MDATSYVAVGSVLVCVLAGTLACAWLARRSRGWRAALPLCAVTAAVCAFVLGYVASSDAIAALQSTAGDYGLRLEVEGGYSSLHAVVLGQAFLLMFPVGLVAGNVSAWAAHRRVSRRQHGGD